MKILLTGGAGFIGSHISKQLLDLGHEVIIYDNFSTSSKENINSRATLVEGSVKDSETLIKSLEGVDAVIHMASFISVEESVKDPVKYMDNNVLGTAVLLDSMNKAGVKKIVFSSSATVYGEPKSLPLTEDAPLSAANPYAASKIAMEALCESFNRTHGFDVIILRYFNPYGPGEKHEPETHAIPNFIMAGLSQGPDNVIPASEPESSEVSGSRVQHGMTAKPKKLIPLYWKGEQVRDFIYVEDLAAAHIAVLDQKGYQIFNVGSETGVKIIDVVNKLSDIFGFSLEVENLGDRAGDVMANYASSEKLKSAAGWQAKVGLDEGLRRTVDYFKSLT